MVNKTSNIVRFFICFLLLFILLCYNNVYGATYVSKSSTSLLQFGLDAKNLSNGYYNVTVNGKVYPIHLYVFHGNQTWNSDKYFGDSGDIGGTSTNAVNMVMVVVDGNLTIGSSGIVRPYYSTTGGPKGFALIVTGDIYNYGNINNEHGGKHAGEDVYLWRNSNGTYDTVPALGGAGGGSRSVSTQCSSLSGIAGSAGSTYNSRATGGGGGGGAAHGCNNGTTTSGGGRQGTSYSGGSGGGAGGSTYGNATGTWATAGGGAGGNGAANSGSTSADFSPHAAGGGAGNPAGNGAIYSTKLPNSSPKLYAAESKTGGLLLLYGETINNYNGASITTKGGNGGYGYNASSGGYVYASGGGGSGGGSLNTYSAMLTNSGTISAAGGTRGTGVNAHGGDGGAGTITNSTLIIDSQLSNPTLSNLSVNPGAMSPSFDPATKKYYVTLDKDDYKTNVSATLSSNKNSIVSGLGEIVVPAGTSTHTVSIMSKIGVYESYTIEFYREPNGYPYLDGIKVNDEEIPNFDPTNANYQINVPYNMEEVDIEGILGRPNQTILGAGKVNVNTGSNTIIITTVSEDGNHTFDYVLNINREHTSKLKDLKIKNYTIEFDPETLTYTLDVLSSTLSLNVTPIPFDDEATVSIKGLGYIKTSTVGEIQVSEPHSTDTIYKIIVNKMDNNSPLVYDFPYTGNIQEFVVPYTGYYRLETWGAQGGSSGGVGGYGAYSTGAIYLQKDEILYIAVGGQGGTYGDRGSNESVWSWSYGGYNGGGNGYSACGQGAGGGATHIATETGLLASFATKNDKLLIVSGGGGGAYHWKGGNKNGGSGAGYAASGINGVYAYGTFGQGGEGRGNRCGGGGGGGGYQGGNGGSNIGQGGGGTGYIANKDLISFKDITKVMYGYGVPTTNSEDKYTVSTNKYSSTPTSYYAKSGNGHARITLMPQPSENNFLSSLTVRINGESRKYNPDFDKATEDYYLTVDKTETEGEILARLEDSTATIEGLGEVEILAKENIYEIKVTAEAGLVIPNSADTYTKTYRVHITRPADDNPYPNDIIINGLVPSLCSASPIYCDKEAIKFDKDTHTYYLTVPSRIKQLWFTVEKGHKYQTVTDDGKVSLRGGENNITITVKSEDQQHTSTYNYIITRDMTGDTDLDHLRIVHPNNIEINFNPDISEYYLTLPNSYTSIHEAPEGYIESEDVQEIDAKLDIATDDSNATYIISGNEILETGMNKVNIFVTAQNGETRTYTLNIYRMKDGNVLLNDLGVSSDVQGLNRYELKPIFNKGNIGAYSCVVENDVSQVYVVGTPEKNTTNIIDGLGLKTLKTGENVVLVKTRAENGDTEEYKIIITRKKNSNAYLSGLSVQVNNENQLLEPNNTPFDKTELNYIVNVSEGVSTIAITAIPEVSTTTYKLLDNNNIMVGENKKRVMSIAEDGQYLIYTITVLRPASTNNYLRDIELSNGTLDPNNNPFDKTIEEYNVEVENEVSEITVNGIKDNDLSRVLGNGKYSLAVGENKITLTVISEDNIERHYNLYVTRKPNSNAYLSNIATSEGVIVTDHNNINYELNIGSDVNKLSVLGIAEVSTTNVTPEDVVIDTPTAGVYTHQIITLAEDGISSITYTLTINKAKSSNAKLASLIMEEGAIKPKFTPEVEEYTVKVARNVTSGTFHYTPEDNRVKSIEIEGNENFEIGENEVRIKVTAEDDSTKTYKVKVIRQELTSNYLLDLKVKGIISNSYYNLNQTFKKDQQYYEVVVPYSENRVNIIAQKEDGDATLTGDGTYNLTVGDNLAVIEITSLDNLSRTYQIKITRKASPEARLESLVLENGTLSPSFSKDVYAYETSTDQAHLNFSKIIPIENDATYEILNNDLSGNEIKEVTIRVTAPDGETIKDYIIKVNKKESDNNNLSYLGVENYEIQPTYAKYKTLYTLTVPNDVNSVNVIAKADHELSTVTGDGVYTLLVGENNIVVEVTSESGKKKSYVIVVTKEGSNVNTLDDIIVKNGIMTPAFDGRDTYDVTVPYEEEKLDLEIKLSDDAATYQVLDNKLIVGGNVVKIVVTAENGNQKTYTLNVERKEIVSAKLINLKAKNYELSPTFNGNINNYSLLLNNETNKIDLTIKPVDNLATWRVLGTEITGVGEETKEIAITANVGIPQTIEVEVTDRNGIQKETYTINVTKQPYANTFLDYLYTSEGDVIPTFIRTTMEYKIEVENNVSVIELYGEPNDRTAKVTGASDPGSTVEADINNRTHTLQVGVNKIPITVESTTGVIRKYYVEVTRKASSANYLETLIAKVGGNSYTITPDFEKTNGGPYRINVPVGTESINLIGTISENATVVGLGIRSLEGGENNLDIVVTAEDGSTRTYTVIVTRPKSNNNHLIDLIPSVGKLEPEFNYEERNYTINLDSAAAFLSFDVVTEDNNATVEGIESKVVPDGTSMRIIKVIAEDGTLREYIITINKERTDIATLASLSVTGYPFENITVGEKTYTATFNSNVFEYHITVPNSKKVLLPSEVVATASDPNAKISKSNNLNLLTTEENVFVVTVTAPDGFTKEEYKIYITRRKSNEALLNNLIVNIGELTAVFNPNVREYTWIVPKNAILVPESVTATSSDPNAKIEKTERLVYTEGATNIYEVKVTSEDGSNSVTYKLKLQQNISGDVKLKSLEIDKGYYTPTFNPDTLTYDVYEYDNETNINITAIPNDPTSHVIFGNGLVDISGNVSRHEIIVQSESGIEGTYVLNIHKTIKSDKTLDNLYVDGLDNLTDVCIDEKCVMLPSFDSDIEEYNIKVPYEYEDLNIHVDYKNDQQSHKLKINDSYVTSYKLPVGITSVNVEVYDGFNILTKTYIVNIDRSIYDNNHLKILYVEGFPFKEETVDLDTNFDYHIVVPHSKDKLLASEVVAEKLHDGAIIEKDEDLDLLTTRDNIFKVTVTAPDGVTKQIYNIHVERTKNSETYLTDLEVNVGHLTTDFHSDLFEYIWKVPKNTVLTKESTTEVANDPNSVIVKPLKLEYVTGKDNVFEIMVMSEDGSKSVIYKLNVEIDESIDATLASLVIDKGYYEPKFDENITSYDAYEYEDETEINVEATPSVISSIVTSGNGKVLLDENPKAHTIIVTAEDGTTQNYILNIHKNIKRDKTINNLYIKGLDKVEDYCDTSKCVMSPNFAPNIIEYSIIVPNEYTNLDVGVEYANNQQSHKIKINGEYVENYELPVGNTKVFVEIYDGLNNLVNTYSINVERARTSNNYLKSLSVDEYNIDPEFNKLIQEYTIMIPNEVDEVTIHAETEDPNAHKYINGYNFLQNGENEATIEVVAEDGSTRTYIIHIIKSPLYNSYLKLITVSTGVFWELTPKFYPTKYTYTTTVGGMYEKATVEAVPMDPMSIVSGTGEYDLKVGPNEVTLTSTNPMDGSISIYKVIIIREQSLNVDIENLIVEEGDLQPSFEKGRTNYEVYVDATVDHITPHVTLSDKTSTYMVLGNEYLTTGDNIVSIVVMNSAKTVSKTYQITVHKDKDTRNKLTSLKVYNDENVYLNKSPLGEYEQTFDIRVGTNIDNVTIEVQKESDVSRVVGDGLAYLDFGNNEKIVEVTSQSGAIKVYVINIFREYNLNLASLISDKGFLEPEFSPSVQDYTINLGKDDDVITFIATPESNKVTVTGTNTYNLEPGENIIDFIVSDPYDNTKKYTVKVVRAKDTNNYIRELQVKGIMTPTFEKITQEYSIYVRKENTKLDITNIVLDSDVASYEVKNNSLSTNLDEAVDVEIEVTAQSGDKRVYTLHVTRKPDEFFSNRLSNLTINHGQLTPDFDADINNYAATVEYSIEKVVLTATPEDEDATVTGDGEISLSVGRNEVSIVVTSKDGVSTNNYSVVIYRNDANDATLKSLSVKDHIISPGFSKLVEDYTIEIDSTVDKLDITAIPTEDKAKVEISGNMLLHAGDNTVTIKVTAPDNVTTKTYRIVAKRAKSTNNYLKSLNVAGYTLSTEFNKYNQGPYVINVDSNITNVLINAEPEVTLSTVSGDGVRNLVTGKNTLDISVTSEAGDVRTYTVVVNKPASTDSTLKNILLSDGELDPAFNSGILEYEVEVSEEVESITVTGIVNDDAASVTGNGRYTFDENGNDIDVKLVVTAEDGNQTTYKVKLKREIVLSSLLKKLVVKDGELYPRFHKLITDYTILIPNEVKKLNMEYAPEDKEATVVLTGNGNFKIGTNKVHIVVTSKDGSSTTDYTISAVRQSSASNYLKSLSVEGYNLKPSFDKTVMYYEVDVPSSVDTVKISAKAEDPTSTVSGMGFKSVNMGENRFYVTVESASGVIRSYQIVINKGDEDTDKNQLLTLTTDVGIISPTFDPEVNGPYTIEVPEKTKYITLDGTATSGSTISGLGKSEISVGETSRNISVTSPSGDVNTYEVKVVRPASNNTNLISLTPSSGTLEYTNDETHFEMEVEDENDSISFIAIPEDEDAIITGVDSQSLDYGENTIKIEVTAEDGTTKRVIEVVVTRMKNLLSIIPDEENLLLSVTEEVEVTYTLDPVDTSYPEVEWISDDENIVRINEGNKIEGRAVGTTTVKIVSTHDNTIMGIINVKVVNKRILSEVYDIVRPNEGLEEEDKDENAVDYVIGIEPTTKLEDFILNFLNEPTTLHVYNKKGVELNDSDKVGTSMVIKLIIDDVEYDELGIVVRGDLSGEGVVNVTDYNMLNNKLLRLGELTYLQERAADISKDGVINVTDFNRLNSYLLKETDKLN